MIHHYEDREAKPIGPQHIVAAIAFESNTLKQHSALVDRVVGNLIDLNIDKAEIFDAIASGLRCGVIEYSYGSLTIIGAK